MHLNWLFHAITLLLWAAFKPDMMPEPLSASIANHVQADWLIPVFCAMKLASEFGGYQLRLLLLGDW